MAVPVTGLQQALYRWPWVVGVANATFAFPHVAWAAKAFLLSKDLV